MPGNRPRTTAAYQRHRRKIAHRRGFLTPEPERHVLPAATPGTKRYRENVRYGHDLEHRAVEAFASGDVPLWYVSVRPATHAEDMAGIDLWVETDRGAVPVQVKASAARAAAFREQHPGMEIAVVVLHMSMDDATVRAYVDGRCDCARARAQRRAAGVGEETGDRSDQEEGGVTKQEKMLTELLAMRARLDDLIAEVRADNDAAPAKPEPTYMKIDEFCKRWDMSRRTRRRRSP